MFPLFFLLLYGLINYGLLLALQQSMVVAAEDGARAAIACDPEQDADDHAACVAAEARAAAGVALAWLPAAQRNVILGDGNSHVAVDVNDATTPPTVEVTVQFPNYASNPLLPALLTLPFIDGQIPPLPSRLAARSVVRL